MGFFGKLFGMESSSTQATVAAPAARPAPADRQPSASIKKAIRIFFIVSFLSCFGRIVCGAIPRCHLRLARFPCYRRWEKTHADNSPNFSVLVSSSMLNP